jgi:hypothetical protein|tara:strand:+ start:414 stop:623 length:210 start_codon:yes stop_codon:yes gene_type:complete
LAAILNDAENFQNDVIIRKNKRCLYGLGSAITGGVEFEKGPFFYIEWLPEYFDDEGELMLRPCRRLDQR